MTNCSPSSKCAALVVIVLTCATWQGRSAFGAKNAADWQNLMVYAVQAQRRGELEEANRLAIEALEIARQANPMDTRVARSQMLLGEIHRWARKFDLAEQSFQEAVASCERVVGPNDPQMAPPLDSLANFYYNHDAQYEKVLPIYKRLLRIVERDPKLAERDVAQRARNLGNIHHLLGQNNEAEANYKRSIELIEQISPDSPDLLQFLLTLAEFYSAQDRCAEAERLAKRAVAICEESSGRDSLDTATSLDGLAAVYMAWDKDDEAEPLCSRALAIHEAIVGSESTDLAPRLLGLANAQRAQGKYDDAEDNYRRAITVVESGLGRDAPELVPILEAYALLLKNTDRAKSAAVNLARAKAIRSRYTLRGSP